MAAALVLLAFFLAIGLFRAIFSGGGSSTRNSEYLPPESQRFRQRDDDHDHQDGGGDGLE